MFDGENCCGVGYMVGENRSMRDSVREAVVLMLSASEGGNGFNSIDELELDG